MVQTLHAAPIEPGAEDAHDALAHWDDETRGWAMLALGDAGLNPSATTARISITDWADVPADDRAGIPSAPNAMPAPDPVFAALDDVEDTQVLLQRAEVRRVTAAVTAWRTALRIEGDPTAHGTPYQKGFLIDLGLKLKVADTTADALVHAADRLEHATPLAWAEFLAGRVPWRAMQLVHTQLDGLDPRVLPAFDAGAVQKLAAIPVPRLAEALRRLRERLQASTADDRHDAAAKRSRVTIEPAADGMGYLNAYLPMVDLLGLDHQLTKSAIAAHGREGETRGIQALKAAVLVDGLRSVLRTSADPSDPDLRVPGRRGVEPRVAILIPAMTALGHATVPPILQGYGPIGIRTALRLAGEAKSWVRVLTDPFTGAVLDLGRKKYRPTKDMRTLLRLLDGGGRGPACRRGPDETDVDHVRSYRLHDEQGRTAIDNLMLLSRKDHGVKTAGEADLRLLGDRTSVWSTRAGNRYVTRPHDPPEPTPVPPELLDEDDCPF